MALGIPRLWLSIAIIAHLAMAGRQDLARTPRSNLTGVVTDSAGLAIPGARIVLIRESDQRITVTSDSGRYGFDGLSVGTYRIGVSLLGFPTKRGQVQISENRSATWNATLTAAMGVPIGAGSTQPIGLDQTDAALALGVYTAVLLHVYQGTAPERPVVGSVSLIQPFDELEWPAQLASVPLSLQRSSSTPQARRSVTLRPEFFLSGTRLVEAPGLEMPSTSLSRPFVTDDRLGALVVFAHSCGTLCGEQTVVWLQRSSTSTPWTIRATYTIITY